MYNGKGLIPLPLDATVEVVYLTTAGYGYVYVYAIMLVTLKKPLEGRYVWTTANWYIYCTIWSQTV